jgi:nitroreductase
MVNLTGGKKMIIEIMPEIKNTRKADYDIDPLFIKRWSPRAMSAESLTDQELMPLFEAARWAPSSFNAQQRRFLYAKRDTDNWDIFYDLMVEKNQSWAKNAAVLVVAISRKNFEYNDQPSVTNVFDSGAAWENLALEAARRGLVAHGMQGFDYQKARAVLNVPDNYEVCAMIAIGKPGDKEDLPQELQNMEQPNGRRPLKEIAIEGTFRGK